MDWPFDFAPKAERRAQQPAGVTVINIQTPSNMSKAKKPTKNKTPAGCAAASGSVVIEVRDTICNGCVIRPLPDMGAGQRYQVTLIRTGEARVVRMPYGCLSNDTTEKRLITVMNALEWSDPLNDADQATARRKP